MNSGALGAVLVWVSLDGIWRLVDTARCKRNHGESSCPVRGAGALAAPAKDQKQRLS